MFTSSNIKIEDKSEIISQTSSLSLTHTHRNTHRHTHGHTQTDGQVLCELSVSLMQTDTYWHMVSVPCTCTPHREFDILYVEWIRSESLLLHLLHPNTNILRASSLCCIPSPKQSHLVSHGQQTHLINTIHWWDVNQHKIRRQQHADPGLSLMLVEVTADLQ